MPPSRRNTRSHISVHSLPRTDVSGGSSVTKDMKEKLARLAPDGKRCLITRDKEPLRCCHLLARSTRTEILKNLERAWGINAGEFRLHTPSNLVWLRQDLYARFDNDDWALMPTMEVLKEMVLFEFTRRGQPAPLHYTQKFPDKLWDYHFVPFRRSPIVFARFNDSCEFYQIHDYPFDRLGLLRSHVHPFFSVYNMAEKAIYHTDRMKEPNSDTQLTNEFSDHLTICVTLFHSWNTPAPETLESRTTSRSSHVTRSQSSEKSQQQNSERDNWARRRYQNTGTDIPPLSGPGTSAPQERKQTEATLASERYLPTPEHSVHSVNDCEQRLMNTISGTSFATRHWTNINDWIMSVKSCGPYEDPYEGGTEHAQQLLAQYAHEVVRDPPGGPWEKWIAEYELV